MIDNYKDHVKRAYNFAIIKDVTRDFSSNKFFLHFFTSEKPLPYVSAYECQRDFTVDAILLAISQARQQQGPEKQKPYLNPDSIMQTLKRKNRKTEDQNFDFIKHSELQVIQDDYVVLQEPLLVSKVQKRNKSFGLSDRFLMLGYAQILISRDQYFEKLVGVVPLLGGQVLIRIS